MSSAPAAAAQGPGVVKGTDAEAGSAVRGLGWAGRIRSVRLSQSRRAIPNTFNVPAARFPAAAADLVCAGTYLMYLGS